MTDKARYITLDDFKATLCDSFACAAAWAVCKAMGRAYNPLCIFGDNELAKAKLKQSLLSHIRESLALNVISVAADDFCHEYRAALKEGADAEYRDKYRNAGALVVDSLDRLGKCDSRQQSQFGNMIRSLHADFKQIVMFSDVPVTQIQGLVNRNLLSQFEWGLEVELNTGGKE